MNSEVDTKCYLCDLFLEYEEFGDIKKRLFSKHECWKQNQLFPKNEFKNQSFSKEELNSNETNNTHDSMIIDSEIQNDQSPESHSKADHKVFEPKNKKKQEKTKVVVNPGKNSKQKNVPAPRKSKTTKDFSSQRTPILKKPKRCPKKHVCKLCGYDTKYHSHMRKHQMRKHARSEEDFSFRCDTCPRGFASKLQFKTHKKNCPVKVKKYLCSDCDRSYASKTARSEHWKGIHGPGAPVIPTPPLAATEVPQLTPCLNGSASADQACGCSPYPKTLHPLYGHLGAEHSIRSYKILLSRRFRCPEREILFIAAPDFDESTMDETDQNDSKIIGPNFPAGIRFVVVYKYR